MSILVGTPNSETIVGTPEDDFIHGYAGDDILLGGDGNDVIGTIWGDCQIEGGRGNDVLAGGMGNDILEGGEGNDFLVGSGGHDTYIFKKGFGHDVLTEFSGTATLDFTSFSFDLTLNLGAKDLFAGSDKLTFKKTNQVDNLFSGSGDDLLIGNVKDNILDGGSGNDILKGEGGNDLLLGGPGNDTYYAIAGIDSDIIYDLSGDHDVLGLNSFRTHQISNWEAQDNHGSDGFVDDLLLSFTSGKTILIQNYYDDSSSDPLSSHPGNGQIESIQFRDKTFGFNDIPLSREVQHYFIFEGDSLTDWGNPASDEASTWPTMFRELSGIQDHLIVKNHAIAGSTNNTIDQRDLTSIDHINYDRLVPNGDVTLVMWAGTNDMAASGDNQSGQGAYADLRTNIQHRAASGNYDHIVLLTTIPRSGFGLNAKISEYNNLILANDSAEIKVDGVDLVVNLSTNTAFDDFTFNSDYGNQIYYNPDGVHLADAGHLEVATTLWNALQFDGFFTGDAAYNATIVADGMFTGDAPHDATQEILMSSL